MTLHFSLPRQHFLFEVRQPEEDIHLARAALYIAQEEYPDLDLKTQLDRLAQMAATVAPRLPSERYPLKIIRLLNDYLFDELGFCGNREDYYDPRNSFLNQVLDRRTGIPISLSLVYLDLAQRVNFPMVGIGMPGHFLIRPEFEEANIYVDAFAGGEILFPQDCADRLGEIYGQPITLRPELLPPIGPRRFLARLLTNLKGIYIQQGEAGRALAVIERLLLLFPDAPLELRDRGLLCYQAQRYPEARRDLEQYLTLLPRANDRMIIRELLDRLDQRVLE